MKLLLNALKSLHNAKCMLKSSKQKFSKYVIECIKIIVICRAMQDHQWELFSKLFAQNDSVIAKMINECPTEKDLELKDRNRRNVSSGKRMKCDEAALMNTMKE